MSMLAANTKRALTTSPRLWVGIRSLAYVSVVCLAVLGASWVPVSPARAQIDSEVKDQVAAATVLIASVVVRFENGEPEQNYMTEPMGSGVIISDDGLILTNHHVVDRTGLEADIDIWANTDDVELEIEEEYVIYTVDGDDDAPSATYSATLEHESPGRDLAVLRITGDELGNPLRHAVGRDRSPVSVRPEPITAGEDVSIFGYPEFGEDSGETIGSTTIDSRVGRVSQLKHGAGVGNLQFALIDVTVGLGNSGGSVVDENGMLLAIMTAAREGAAGGSAALAIPIDRARAILEDAGWVEPTPTPTPSPVTETPIPTSSPTETILVAPIEIAYYVETIQPLVIGDAATYDVRVYIAGSPEQLAGIAYVTYYLHPTFTPSVITIDTNQNAFQLDFNSWGEFEIQAEVTSTDGSVTTLSRYLEY